MAEGVWKAERQKNKVEIKEINRNAGERSLLLSLFLVCQNLLLGCKILCLIHGRTPILRKKKEIEKQ